MYSDSGLKLKFIENTFEKFCISVKEEYQSLAKNIKHIIIIIFILFNFQRWLILKHRNDRVNLEEEM